MKNQDHYKNTGIVIVVFVLISLWLKTRYNWPHYYATFAVLAVGFLLLSFEKASIFFSDYWMKFGKLLGKINGSLLLTVFFLLILTPLAIIKKLISGKTHNDQQSLYTTVEDEKIDFTKTW